MEDRIQGGEPETLKQAIEIMLLSEQTVRMLDKKGGGLHDNIRGPIDILFATEQTTRMALQILWPDYAS